jgi:hypothetical protein
MTIPLLSSALEHLKWLVTVTLTTHCRMQHDVSSEDSKECDSQNPMFREPKPSADNIRGKCLICDEYPYLCIFRDC